MPAAPFYLPARDAIARAAIWGGFAACAAGLVVQRMWTALPAARFGESLVLAGLASGLALLLVRFARLRWANALACVWLASLAALSGPVPVLVVAGLAAALAGLGSAIVGSASPVRALVAGAVVLAGTLGWLLPLPVHRPWIYLAALALIVIARRRALAGMARHALEAWRGAVGAHPRAAAFGVLTLGLASGGAWLPTMQYDDLAYHLGLPWQLMQHGRYALDPTHQVWALAPWAGDVLHGVAQVIARTEARGALNAMWLLASAALAWQLAALAGARPLARWGAVALFATLPLLAALMAGMQTELPATAVTLALAACVFGAPGRAPRAHELLALGVLTGGLIALKPLHAMAAAPLLLLALWRWRASWRSTPAAWASAFALIVLVGASSYAHAWRVSGNPVLPLFNSVFQSPYFAVQDFSDARWMAGGGAALPWRITFDTARYFEGWDGGFSFALVAFAGAALVALVRPHTRAMAACALLAIALPLLAVQYARYAFVGLVLLVPVAAATLHRHLPARQSLALIAGLCVLNLAYQANSNWMLRTGAVKRAVAAFGRDAPLLERYAPERLLAARIRADRPGAVVLDLSGAAHAEFVGAGRTRQWYAPALEQAARDADGDPSGARWAALLRRERIEAVLLRPATLEPAQRAGLARLGAHPAVTAGEAQWWHITESTAP